MTKSRKTYYLFHILNDFSGSPKVLRQVAETLLLAHEVIIVSSDSEGFLSNIAGAKHRKISYAWSPKKWLTLLNFFKVQLVLFFKALFLPKGAVVYVNTLLPFGAALGGKLRGLEVVYHLHEPQVQPAILFALLKKVAKITSNKQIYVSHYLESQLKDLWIENRKVIHNSIPDDFLQKAATITSEKETFEILMACSLKKYKGVYEFIQLASKIPEVSFKLIVNSEGGVFNQFLEQNKVTKNCTLLSAQKNMMQHYAKASVVLNLSDKNEWVESFGLTIIEAMAFGLPVIVPIVGGPVEIIQEGISGYAIDSKNEMDLVEKIKLLFANEALYAAMSQAAKNRAQDFSNQAFKTKIKTFLN